MKPASYSKKSIRNSSIALVDMKSRSTRKKIKSSSRLMKNSKSTAWRDINCLLKKPQSVWVFTPDVPPGGGLWFFPKSGSIASSFQDRMVKRAKEEGCEVQQGWRLQEVLTSESGKETYGVKIVNTETGATKVMRSADVYTSLGKAGTWDFQDVSAKNKPTTDYFGHWGNWFGSLPRRDECSHPE